MASTPDLACMVGLFAYNSPPLPRSGEGKRARLAKIKNRQLRRSERGFSRASSTATSMALSASSLTITATISVRILSRLANGDKSVIPARWVSTK